MTHVFFWVMALATFALCAFGIMPSDQLVDLSKWLVVVYAASTTAVTIMRAMKPQQQIGDLSVPDAVTPDFPAPPWSPDQGTGHWPKPGVFEGDVFSGAIGDGLPDEFTNFTRDHEAPPVSTESASGATVMVPSDGPALRFPGDAVPPLDFDVVFGPKPPIPHDYNRRPALTRPVNRGLAERLAGDANKLSGKRVVVLGDLEPDVEVEVDDLIIPKEKP